MKGKGKKTRNISKIDRIRKETEMLLKTLQKEQKELETLRNENNNLRGYLISGIIPPKKKKNIDIHAPLTFYKTQTFKRKKSFESISKKSQKTENKNEEKNEENKEENKEENAIEKVNVNENEENAIEKVNVNENEENAIEKVNDNKNEENNDNKKEEENAIEEINDNKKEEENKNEEIKEEEIKDEHLNENEYVKEYIDSKNFIKTLDIESTKQNINKYTDIEINEQTLIECQLNNKENYEKINNNIDELCDKILNNKLTPLNFLNIITLLSSNLRTKMIYEIYHNPENYISFKEIEESEEESSIAFSEGILSKILIKNNISTAIKNNNDNNEKLNITLLQLISSGEAFKKKILISYKLDNDKTINLLSKEEEKENFIQEKKNYISNVLNIPLDKIHITNIINNTLTLNITLYLSLNSILEDSIINNIEDENIVSIKIKPLLEYYIISEDNFDLRGNRTIENFEDGIRGPEDNLQKYISPKNYFGLGLKVKNNFYDINNEWYIAYYNSLYIPYNYNKEHLNCNHLSSEKFHFCDYGIFLNQNCEKIENENCVIEYKGNTYFYNFMCIVNPEFVRISDENFNECYWVVSSDFDNNIERNYSEEIRPSKIILRMK